MVVLETMPNKAGIVVVRCCTRFDTIIAPRTSIKIDHHCLCTVDRARLDEEFQHIDIESRSIRKSGRCCLASADGFRLQLFRELREIIVLEDPLRYEEARDVADSAKSVLVRNRIELPIAIVVQFVETENAARAEITDRSFSPPVTHAQSGKTRENQNDPVGEMAFRSKDGLAREATRRSLLSQLPEGHPPFELAVRLKLALGDQIGEFLVTQLFG